MIKIHSTPLVHRWLYVMAAGLVAVYIGHLFYEAERGPAVPAANRQDGFGQLIHGDASPGATAAAIRSSEAAGQGGVHIEGAEHTSSALDTGMEDWKKPENADLHAELQRWYDHREESSLAQRRADASALMAKVEAQQAAGKIGQTSAALAKLMLLQGAPSDDPQHAVQLQQVMAQLAGQLSFGE